MKSVINAPWNKNQKEFSKQVGDYKIHFIYELKDIPILSHFKLILNTSNEYNYLSHYEMPSYIRYRY